MWLVKERPKSVHHCELACVSKEVTTHGTNQHRYSQMTGLMEETRRVAMN